MEKIEYQRLADREHFYWWNVGRRSILEEALRRHLVTNNQNLDVLDIGCGPGGNLLFLERFGFVTGLDISKEALRLARDKNFKKLVQGSAETLPFPDASFNVVSILDVLEHVNDDEGTLGEIARVLKKDGVLLLTVPAHRWLWSRHDEALHHKRRYAAAELRRKIARAGLQRVEMSHFVIPGVPALFVREALRKTGRYLSPNGEEKVDTYNIILPPFLNRLLILWLTGEKHVMKIFPIPVGSSLLLIAKK